MNKLRLPALNAPTPEGKLEQLRSYLFQLTDHINRLQEHLQTVAERSVSVGELADAVKTKIQKTFIQKKQLETEEFALRGSVNGLHIHSLSGTGQQGDCLLQTKFSQFTQGYDYQLFFLFGVTGGTPFQRVLRVDQSGLWLSDGTLNLQKSTARPGAMVLMLEGSADRLTVLSPDSFSLE